MTAHAHSTTSKNTTTTARRDEGRRIARVLAKTQAAYEQTKAAMNAAEQSYRLCTTRGADTAIVTARDTAWGTASDAFRHAKDAYMYALARYSDAPKVLVRCVVPDGSLVCEHCPDVPGIAWGVIPDALNRIGEYYQEDFAAFVPAPLVALLPDNCEELTPRIWAGSKLYAVASLAAQVAWDAA